MYIYIYFKNPLLSSALKTSDKCCTSATSVLMRGQNAEGTQRHCTRNNSQTHPSRGQKQEKRLWRCMRRYDSWVSLLKM